MTNRPTIRETAKDPVRLLLLVLALVCIITGVALLAGGVDNGFADFVMPIALILVGGAFVLALVRYAKRRM